MAVNPQRHDITCLSPFTLLIETHILQYSCTKVMRLSSSAFWALVFTTKALVSIDAAEQYPINFCSTYGLLCDDLLTKFQCVNPVKQVGKFRFNLYTESLLPLSLIAETTVGRPPSPIVLQSTISHVLYLYHPFLMNYFHRV